MRKIISLLAVLAAPAAFAAGGSEFVQEFTPDTTNKASLQRGARLFVNYCMSCHSAGYHRYSHLARDLHLSERQVQDNLIFTTDENGAPTKPGALMVVPMTDKYAKEAFGTVPPNLSLVSRARGASWLYSYLKGFYLDETREPIGVNNTVFPDVGMPHVMWELQGFQVPVYKTEKTAGGEIRRIERLEIAVPGEQSAEEFDDTVADLVNFLVYLGEPARLERQRLGIWIILFLLVFTIIAYYLKREYWKDVH
jgi:ubiquinol-cytochrome c reductase cytochrome c1 subunit